MARDPRPACLITGTVSPYRREPFRLLCEAEDVEVLAFEDAGEPLDGLRARTTTQAEAVAAVAAGHYRAVICGTGGRVALPGSYLAARARRVPFVLWATIWEHPRTLAHRLSFRPTRHLYRHADAVVTYGSHVSRYVAGHRGSDEGIVIAPQAVDVAHFGARQDPAAVAAAREQAGAGPDTPLVLFVGRLESEKGIETLLEAWSRAGLGDRAVLAMAGAGPLDRKVRSVSGVRGLDYVSESDLPPLYAAADVLVLPSIPTATFREPWGLVVNEAMLQHTPVITTDAVGAAAGGLVVDGATGAVVPAGDVSALGGAIERFVSDPTSRARMGDAARDAALALDPEAWCAGMRTGLAIAGPADDRAASLRVRGRGLYLCKRRIHRTGFVRIPDVRRSLFPMTRRVRHLIAPALLISALAFPVAAQADPVSDCASDGSVDGNYTNAQLKKALDNISSDVDEYSDCRAAIQAAMKTGSKKKKQRSGGATAGASSSGGSAGGDDSAAPVDLDGDGSISSSERQAAKDKQVALKRENGRAKTEDRLGAPKTDPTKVGALDASDTSNGLPTPVLLAIIALALLAVAAGTILAGRRNPAFAQALRRIPTPRVPIPKRFRR